MTLAAELAAKYLKQHYKASSVGELPALAWDATVAAINEAIERCAQEIEVPLCSSQDCKCRIFAEQNAARIRALKDSAV